MYVDIMNAEGKNADYLDMLVLEFALNFQMATV